MWTFIYLDFMKQTTIEAGSYDAVETGIALNVYFDELIEDKMTKLSANANINDLNWELSITVHSLSSKKRITRRRQASFRDVHAINSVFKCSLKQSF